MDPAESLHALKNRLLSLRLLLWQRKHAGEDVDALIAELDAALLLLYEYVDKTP
jgi:hypothetical protein